MDSRRPCPCCGHLVFDVEAGWPGSYEICPVCFWEDDAVQLRWPGMAGRANRTSLVEAQRHLEQFGAADAGGLGHARSPTRGEPLDSQGRPIDPERDSFEEWDSSESAPWPQNLIELCWWLPQFWRRATTEPKLPARVEHPWLGELREHGAGVLLGRLDVDVDVRPARENGETDAEVLVHLPRADAAALTRALDAVAQRIRSALDNLEAVKEATLALAPADWKLQYEAAGPVPLRERLFLEGFTVLTPQVMEIAFDFGDLDQLIAVVDANGSVVNAYLAP